MNGDLSLLERACGGDRVAEEEFLCANTALVWSIVRRFGGRGTDTDDLFQLACIGFIKAVRGFDFTYGTQFSTYAVPKIAGEIRRFLRDDGILKVSRSMRERAATISAARAELLAKLGREPTLREIGEATGLEVSEIAEAELASEEPLSLQTETENGGTAEDFCGTESPEDGLAESLCLRMQIDALPEEERRVIALRYFRGFTQERAARILHVSQVQVSRLEKRAVGRLRERLETT